MLTYGFEKRRIIILHQAFFHVYGLAAGSTPQSLSQLWISYFSERRTILLFSGILIVGIFCSGGLFFKNLSIRREISLCLPAIKIPEALLLYYNDRTHFQFDLAAALISTFTLYFRRFTIFNGQYTF
ncbi:hypothetical protein BDF20DRAFT_883966 [Mycotypha africana]|uniref:uncharacterized protein n=1 Tax=Mycotypha africana TaxID=64632 RepID=UPI002300FF29|nr:uncharacterized protein BDF20DRAFT_883966 [Mycotypha africana]KAI8973772.1 hypothetical protein BDF20DRAFT_883966 [Mycotypha africana]